MGIDAARGLAPFSAVACESWAGVAWEAPHRLPSYSTGQRWSTRNGVACAAKIGLGASDCPIDVRSRLFAAYPTGAMLDVGVACGMLNRLGDDNPFGPDRGPVSDIPGTAPEVTAPAALRAGGASSVRRDGASGVPAGVSAGARGGCGEIMALMTARCVVHVATAHCLILTLTASVVPTT